MSNYIHGPNGALYDATTGQFVGFKDLSGRELFVGEVTGTITQMLTVAPAAGAFWATDTGMEFIGKLNPVTGNTYYWAPRGGQQTLFRRGGSLSALFALMTGVTAGQFTIAGGNPTIPAGLLLPGVSAIHLYGGMGRLGANGTATMNIRFGTAGTTGDSTTTAAVMTTTDQQQYRFDQLISIQAAGRYFSSMQGALNATSTVGADRTTNVNFAAAMIFSADVAGANALDSFGFTELAIDILG